MKKGISYFAIALPLVCFCILLYENNNRKITDNKTVSAPQISNITARSSEKTDISVCTTKVKNTSCSTSEKAVSLFTTTPVTVPVTTYAAVTQAETQTAAPPAEPVNELPVPQQQENQNDNNVDPDPQPQEPIPEPAPTPVEGGQDAPSANDFQREVLRLVNIRRSEEGTGALSSTDPINQAAQKRAEEISDRFEHTRPDGSSWFSVFGEFNINAFTNGENIAAGSVTPEEVVNQWMNSRDHRNNIMNPSFTTMGIGFCFKDDEYKCYWVQLFAG